MNVHLGGSNSTWVMVNNFQIFGSVVSHALVLLTISNKGRNRLLMQYNYKHLIPDLPKLPLNPFKLHLNISSLISLSNSSLNFYHLAKSYILKSSPMFTCCMTNTVSDVYLFSPVFTQFTYFPQDVSETHTSLHSNELQLILRYGLHRI